MSATELLTSDEASEQIGKWLSMSLSDATKLLKDENYLEDFAGWISEKAASQTKYEKLQPVIHMITNFAILETLQHVFHIGSGFKPKVQTFSEKPEGFTLKQILETVQRTEAKVDTMLKEPLNSAIDYFNAAVQEIRNKSFKHAYNSLDKVIDNATKAFHYVSGQKVDIECFQESIKAIQLLIFARISRYSFDEEKHCFVPYPALSSEQIMLIGDSLEDLVQRSMKQENNVKTSYWSKAEDKNKIQDILDQVLKICYPYISQAKGWTNMKFKINPKDKKFSITVMPKYLPNGFEDSTTVMVGVKTGDDQPSSVLLWRTEKYVYSLYDKIVTLEKITSESDPLQVDILNGNYLMLCELVEKI